MKKIIIAFSLLGIFAISCTKQKGKEVAMERTEMANTANFQIHDAIVGSTRNYLQVDAKFVNGTGLAYGATFPSTPASFNIPAGFKAFSYFDTLATTTQVPMSFAQDLQSGASYTMFMYDSINAPKQMTVTNKIVVPNDTTARLRFANFVYNSGASIGTGFDIFSVKRNAVVFTNVSQTQVTDFIPYASALTDTFYIRTTGSSTNLTNGATTIFASLTPTRLRSYTLIFRGSYRATSGTNAKTLGTFVNY
ncbi:MAG: DUF4397 domain-containing protein [Chitinophagaceae bacterium]|nr:DUF4397 domain-containing protein [Chitinophagaceae bacterium]